MLAYPSNFPMKDRSSTVDGWWSSINTCKCKVVLLAQRPAQFFPYLRQEKKKSHGSRYGFRMGLNSLLSFYPVKSLSGRRNRTLDFLSLHVRHPCCTTTRPKIYIVLWLLNPGSPPGTVICLILHANSSILRIQDYPLYTWWTPLHALLRCFPAYTHRKTPQTRFTWISTYTSKDVAQTPHKCVN